MLPRPYPWFLIKFSSNLSSIINTIDSSIEITANFLTFQAQKTAEIILTRIKSDKYIDSLIGSVLADIILGENDPKQISKNLVKGQLNSLLADKKNNNKKPNKKLVANDNYENIFMLLINKNA